MRLRYQMRGLGIGIIVTALLMGVAKGNKVPLSDAEIKVRALELGMVESDSRRLSDIQSVPVPSGGKEASQPSSALQGDGSQPPEGQGDGSQPSSEGQGGDGSQPSSEGQGSGGSQPSSEGQGDDGSQAPSEGAASGETVTFTIEDGTYSRTVCAMLEDLGLVESAGDFQQYLHKMGYTRVLRAGTYEIAMGTSMEEIAKTLTKK